MIKSIGFFFLLTAIAYNSVAQNFSPAGAPVFQSSYVKPQTITRNKEGHYFIDFGKDAFGTLWVTLKSLQADSLIVHIGEKLSEANTIDKKPGGTIRYQRLVLNNIPVNTVYPVVFTRDKRNDRSPAIALPDSFGRVMPFRYVEIENLQVPVTAIIVTQKVFNYRFNDNNSAFTSSDTVLNQIWDLCKHTIKATSFAGIYIDGDRERIPYEADAYINQLSHYAVDNDYSLARRSNEYLLAHPTWPTEWILHIVPMFYNDYFYTGDLNSIKKNYEALRHKTLIALEREDGLIAADSTTVTAELMKNIGFTNNRKTIDDIVDWPLGERDGYDMVKVNTVVNAFHYYNLKLMAEIAGWLGKKEDSIFFYKRSVLVKNAFNQKLLNNTTGIYIDGEGSAHSSLHANMFALAFGLVPKENISKVVAFIKARGMACSVYGAQYLLDALYQNGEADYALQLMNTTSGDRNWWNMIQAGSTMALEAWDIKYKPNLDWNHAWGTAPANIISRRIWGITPATPGFGKALIKPQLSNLTWSKTKVPTIKGSINAEYKQITGRYRQFIIELPKGVDAEFVIPANGEEKIFLNNKLVKSSTKTLMLKEGKNYIDIR